MSFQQWLKIIDRFLIFGGLVILSLFATIFVLLIFGTR